MNIAALKTEIDTDSLVRGYAGMSDDAVAADLHTANRTHVVDVQSKPQRMWLAQNGRHKKLEAGAANDALGEVVQGLCLSALLMATNDDPYRRVEHKLLLDTLATALVLDQADDADVLDALADQPCSRAVELSLGNVKAGHVASARAM